MHNMIHTHMAHTTDTNTKYTIINSTTNVQIHNLYTHGTYYKRLSRYK